MLGKDVIRMSQKELKRLYVIRKVMEHVLRQREAVEMLNLSTRQIRRITVRVKEEGDRGVVHKLRGKESGRKISEERKEEILRLYREKYRGFGPTLAIEKLKERG